MDPILIRLLIGVLAYFLLHELFVVVITDAQANRIFNIILIFVVVIYVFFGSFFIR